MGASGHGRERLLLLLSIVSSFGHGTSRTKQVTRERGHIKIKKSYLLNCMASMMCLDWFMLNEGKHKREQDTVLSVCHRWL